MTVFATDTRRDHISTRITPDLRAFSAGEKHFAFGVLCLSVYTSWLLYSMETIKCFGRL
jgi:hypothetical protein